MVVRPKMQCVVINNIRVLTVNCIKSSGEYTAAEERGILESGDYKCLDVQTKLKLSYLSYQTQGRTYVKISNSSDWGNPSRTIKVNVGDTVQFQHELKNIGDASDESMGDIVIRANDEYQNVWGKSNNKIWGWDPGNITRRNVASGQTFALATPNTDKVIQLNAHQLSYRIKSSDVGKTLCTRIEWTNGERNMPAIHQEPVQIGNRGTFTGWACAQIAHSNYSQVPSVVAGNGKGCGGTCAEVEAGTPRVPVGSKISFSVENKETKAKDAKWKLTHFVVRPNQKIPGVDTSPRDANGKVHSGGFMGGNDNPCSAGVYNNSSAVYQHNDPSRRIQGCRQIAEGDIKDFNGTKTIDIPSLLTGDGLNQFSVPEAAEVGTKYCFALSVSPYMMNKDWSIEKQNSFKDWYHSKPGCIVVVKKPKTNFLGGGVYSGGGALTSQSVRNIGGNERTFGSWVEYEFVTAKTNQNLATNGVFAIPSNGNSSVSSGKTSDKKWQNRLTFANNSSTYGNFGGIKYAQAFYRRLKDYYQSRSSGMRSLFVLGAEYYSPKTDVNLGGVGSTQGKTTVVFAPNNTVTIGGNIENKNVKVRNVGQTIIIAKNININSHVTRVDAWLIAEDSINTCSSAAALSAYTCSNHLLVNGPVVVASDKANGLKLNRTSGSTGSGDGIGNPGETFLIGYDVYQWIVNRAKAGGVRIKTSYTKELPVRY